MTTGIGINTTTRCNLNCKYCLRDFSKLNDIPLDLFEKILKESKEFRINYVALTGGEPMLHDKFQNLIEIIIENNFFYCINTNGTLIKKNIEVIKKSGKNLVDISISLDGSNKEKHESTRDKGSFEKIIESIELCKKNNLPFSITSIINKNNLDEVENLVKFAIEKRASEITFTTVLPCEKAVKNDLILSLEERKKLYDSIMFMRRKYRFIIKMSTEIMGSNDFINCSTLKMVNWNFDVEGNLVFCQNLCSNQNINQDKIIVGNIKKEPIKDLVKKYSDKIQKFISKKVSKFDKNDNFFNQYSCLACVNHFKK